LLNVLKLADTKADTHSVIVFIIVFGVIVLVRTAWVIYDTHWIVEWYFASICLSGLSLDTCASIYWRVASLDSEHLRDEQVIGKQVQCYLWAVPYMYAILNLLILICQYITIFDILMWLEFTSILYHSLNVLWCKISSQFCCGPSKQENMNNT